MKAHTEWDYDENKIVIVTIEYDEDVGKSISKADLLAQCEATIKGLGFQG